MDETDGIVTITTDAVFPDRPGSLIKQRFADTLGFATQWMDKALEAFDDISEYSEIIGMVEGWRTALDDVTIHSVVPIDFNARSRLGTLVLPDDWPADFPNMPDLQVAPVSDFAYVKPIKPEGVNPTLNYTPAAYNSEMYLALYTAIYNEIQNPGTGIPVEIWEAMLAQRRYAQRRANSTKFMNDMRAAGSTGFSFPNGVVAGIILDSTKDIRDQDENFNKEILQIEFDEERKHRYFVLTKSLEIETLLRDFYDKAENRSFEAQKAISLFILQVYSEKIKAYIAEWDGVKSEMEAKIAIVKLVIEENTAIIEAFKAKATAYTAKVQANTEKIKGLVEGFKGEVAAYEAETNALEAYYKTLTEIQKAEIEFARIKLEKAVAELKALLDSQVSYDTLRAKLAEVRGQIAVQAVVGTLNAVNASVSYGYSGSESISESRSQSKSLSSGHSTEHDPDE
jgi:hypothetical protein